MGARGAACMGTAAAYCSWGAAAAPPLAAAGDVAAAAAAGEAGAALATGCWGGAGGEGWWGAEGGALLVGTGGRAGAVVELLVVLLMEGVAGMEGPALVGVVRPAPLLALVGAAAGGGVLRTTRCRLWGTWVFRGCGREG